MSCTISGMSCTMSMVWFIKVKKKGILPDILESYLIWSTTTIAFIGFSIINSVLRKQRSKNSDQEANSFEDSKLAAMAEKEGAIVKKGHEEGLKMALSLLEEFELPMGLLPLADVIEVGFVRNTGYIWIQQEKKVEHKFKMIGKLVSYDTEISGYIDKKRIKKLKGVKAKELILWPPINEITVDDPPTGNIQIKSLAGITKTLPAEVFAAGQ